MMSGCLHHVRCIADSVQLISIFNGLLESENGIGDRDAITSYGIEKLTGFINTEVEEVKKSVIELNLKLEAMRGYRADVDRRDFSITGWLYDACYEGRTTNAPKVKNAIKEAALLPEAEVRQFEDILPR